MSRALKPRATLVWDLPLRMWHWAFALCVAGSLYTGLSGDIGLMERHLQLGYGMLGLLLFRLAWGLWGGRYARFEHYRSSPLAVVNHFRGRKTNGPHTAPGAAMALTFLALAAVQAGTGLFATDDIFNEGPLTRYVASDLARDLTWIHHRVFWLILGAAAVHLLAQLIYGLRGDPTPLSMFSGRKPVSAEAQPSYLLAGTLTAAMAAALVWFFLVCV